VNETLRIRGGLALPRAKPGLDRPILAAALPPVLVFPLVAHGNRPLLSHVKAGDTVRAGDWLAHGLRASASGRVRSVESRTVLHPRRARADCVVLDTLPSADLPPAPDASGTVRRAELESLLSAGIDGQGGAGFPAADKLSAVRSGGCRLLLINACECEPGVACDEALLQEDAPAVVAAIERLRQALQPDVTLIAIERDKPRAVPALHRSLAAMPQITLLPFEPVYPSGAEAPLLSRVLEHLGLPPVTRAERPTDRGLLCLNVATALALGQALDGTLATTRIVTVASDQASLSRNVRIVLGTPLGWLLERIGQPPSAATRLRIGGPLSGFMRTADPQTLDAPLGVTTHAIHLSASAPAPMPITRPCIRCAACAPVCPANLQPHLLHWHASANAPAELQRLGIDRCLECGCCDVVCPSAIPLTAQFRLGRAELGERARRDAEAERADALIRQRQERRQRETLRRRAALDEAPAPNIAVNAALARAKARARRGARPADRAAGQAADQTVDQVADRAPDTSPPESPTVDGPPGNSR